MAGKRKLQIKKASVKQLTASELKGAVGGMAVSVSGYSQVFSKPVSYGGTTGR